MASGHSSLPIGPRSSSVLWRGLIGGSSRWWPPGRLRRSWNRLEGRERSCGRPVTIELHSSAVVGDRDGRALEQGICDMAVVDLDAQQATVEEDPKTHSRKRLW
jgi:hypothetical protein